MQLLCSFPELQRGQEDAMRVQLAEADPGDPWPKRFVIITERVDDVRCSLGDGQDGSMYLQPRVIPEAC